MHFYSKIISNLIKNNHLQLADSVLVVCGGSFDRTVLMNANLVNVTISNLDKNMGSDAFSPYKWTLEDVEKLSFKDDAFDWVFVHAGLHHCLSPHLALIEMCRVGRKGILVIEARDSFLMRMACKVNMVPEYETESVVLSNYESGGVRNLPIPNYIYRWKEREVQKTIDTFSPHLKNRIRFYYSLRLPNERLSMSSGIKQFLFKVLAGGVKAFHFLFPRQCNSFGFAYLKFLSSPKPWIVAHGENIKMDKSYKLDYKPEKYKRNQATGPVKTLFS
jgi:ubiquinone/menaquinone biosynthesis C-methylase UbiE